MDFREFYLHVLLSEEKDEYSLLQMCVTSEHLVLKCSASFGIIESSVLAVMVTFGCP